MQYLLAYKKIVFLALLVFFIAFITRVIFIDSIPSNISSDAADNLQTYLRYKYSPHFSFFNFNWNGAPAFNPYVIGLFWELFDKSIFGLRFASVLLSSFAVTSSFALFYILSKRLTLSFLLSLSLSSNPWFLNFSREGWENIFNSFFLTLILLGLLFYFRYKKYFLGIVFMTIGAVLGFYGYHPGKFFILAILLCLLIEFIIPKHTLRRKINIFAMCLIGTLFIIFVSPQLHTTILYKEKALGRIGVVSVINAKNPIMEIQKNVINNIKGLIFFDISVFSNNGSPYNIRYLPLDRSPLFIGFLPIYLIGLYIAIRNYPYFFLTFIVTLLPVQILSGNTPDGARGVHILPLLYVFIFLGLNYLFAKAASKKFITISILSIILTASILDTKAYFTWINKTSILASRSTLATDDYPKWQAIAEDQIKKGGWGLDGATWEKIARSQNTYVLSSTVKNNPPQSFWNTIWNKIMIFKKSSL